MEGTTQDQGDTWCTLVRIKLLFLLCKNKTGQFQIAKSLGDEKLSGRPGSLSRCIHQWTSYNYKKCDDRALECECAGIF